MRLAAAIAAIATVAVLAAPGGSKASTGGGASSAYAIAQKAVCYYFGSYCQQAMAVSRCETGGTYSVWAQNGQYHGIFQMGSNERATYGDGNDVWSQARAAYRYFVASGRGWGPWSCKPW